MIVYYRHNEKSVLENNYLNRGFHINPINRPNAKENAEAKSEKLDVRYYLVKRGYLHNYDQIRSPVKDYIESQEVTMFKPVGLFESAPDEDLG